MESLAWRLKDEHIDAIVAIARGGLTLAHFLALQLDIRRVYSISCIGYDGDLKLPQLYVDNLPTLSPEVRKVLIVDEIVDSGRTMQEVLAALKTKNGSMEFLSAVLFQKPSASVEADYFIHKTDDWIEFFWESKESF